MFENLLENKNTGDTLCIELSKRQVGFILGRRGEKITALRKKFKNTKIKIDSVNEKVEISGVCKVLAYGYIKLYMLQRQKSD
jgi:predicted RNA-binding protein YlqC (UPF0109 family)